MGKDTSIGGTSNVDKKKGGGKSPFDVFLEFRTQTFPKLLLWPLDEQPMLTILIQNNNALPQR